ncbi:MAG TPA: hypothetical protein VNJ01_00990 [Bacteriovoracaceae bacterium]|nr:hypothetical protein [Bacteriovoracaceae bacterium]
MKTNKLHGRQLWSLEIYSPEETVRPNPIVTFAPLWTQGRKWFPNPGDKHALLLFKRQMPTKVSFGRAYSGWRASGAREEAELGEGRAFLRWLQKHNISIEWKETDFRPHSYFCHRDAPKHDPKDEMALGLSFAVRPVLVRGRKVKLYVKDNDMLGLLNLPYGNEEDFLELVMSYVGQRFLWDKWRAPAPGFLDWVVSQAKRPVLGPGQLGFRALLMGR